MGFKKKISFELRKVSQNEYLTIESITFSNIAYIVIYIDDIELFGLEFFEGTFLVVEELRKSILNSGEFLLFTGISGIADAAGWDYVKVEHQKDMIFWEIIRDDKLLIYSFSKEEYVNQVLLLQKKINDLNGHMFLEPRCVVYPE